MREEQALLRGPEVARAQMGSLRGWFPVSLGPGSATVRWRFLGDKRFTEPFFEDSFRSQAPQDRQVCSTPLAALDDLPASVPPAAFIFHVSRCGSTLLTQALATLPQCIVMSEPPALDAFFRLHHRHPEQSGGAHTLRQLVAALGQQRSPAERHLVIKFDCWHLPWLDFVHSAFPDTPILFLYRQPAAVLESHRRQPGRQMVPGLIDLTRLEGRLHPKGAAPLAPGDLDGYTIRILESLYRCGLQAAAAAAPKLRLVNHAQLPGVLWEHLLGALGLDCTPLELAALQSRSGFHAKHPHNRFDGDPAPATAGRFMKTAERLDGSDACYEALEHLRMGQGT